MNQNTVPRSVPSAPPFSLFCAKFRAPKDVECPACRGHGEIASPEKKHWSPCRLCKGTGVVTEQQARDWPESP
jgi:hypothetical protein